MISEDYRMITYELTVKAVKSFSVHEAHRIYFSGIVVILPMRPE